MKHTRTLLGIGLAIAALGGPSLALGASNPNGTGQPSQSCEEQSVSPPGFSTQGFANAQTRYAGSGPSASHTTNDHAVSQYDVACYQLSHR